MTEARRLTTTPEETEAILLARQPVPFLERVTAFCRRVWLTYLQVELERVKERKLCIPHERLAMRQAEERRHARKLDDITDKSANSMMKAQCRIDKLETAIRHMEGGV